ncbi:hypothetical protein ABZU92_18470 [Micromonospora arida]|uniref:hypothetical protein n=1 Tax=Micromonospora arida TaxID=2203715 RepID=UPI0033AC67D3
MPDYTAHEIHRLDQAYPAAVANIEHLTGDPARKTHLADVGPEVFAAELTRELAHLATKPSQLAAWAAVATVQLMTAGRAWEEDTDALHAKVDELTTKLADRNASLERVIGERNTLTAERDDLREHLALDRQAVATLREREAATNAALTVARTQAATHANEVGRLVAENARVRQQRDEALPVVEAAKVLAETVPVSVVTYFGARGEDLIDAVRALPKAEATR